MELKNWRWGPGRLVVAPQFPGCGSQGLATFTCPMLLTGKGELGCQYLQEDRRGRGSAQKREGSPPTLAWRLGEGHVALKSWGVAAPWNMAMYKENPGQVVHGVSQNPQNPGGSPVCERERKERMLAPTTLDG